MTRLAVIADIHGNVLALKSVVEDFSTLGVDSVINLGDVVSGPLWPRETIEFLFENQWPTLAGNHDRAVAHEDPAGLGLSDSFAYRNLTAEQRRWLASLPKVIRKNSLLAFHGSPDSDNEYLLEEITAGRKVLRHAGLIEQKLGPRPEKLLLCGHSHIPRCVRLSNGSLVINPGSVGLQAYEEGEPQAYRVETGSPHARYAILEETQSRWSVSFRLVEYDWDRAAQKAAQEDRPDWEVALRTGFSR